MDGNPNTESTAGSVSTPDDLRTELGSHNDIDAASSSAKSALADDPRTSFDRENAASRRASLDKAFASVEHTAGGDEAFRKTETTRRDLRQLLPDMPLGKLIEWVENTDAALKNPATRKSAGESLLRWAVSLPPRATKTETQNSATSFSELFERKAQEVVDREELAQAIRKHGGNLENVLNQTASTLRMIIDDPVGGVARALAVYGEPVTEAHQQEVEHAAQAQSMVADLDAGLQRVIDAKVLPGLENLDVQNKIADVLESKTFKRSGHMGTDLNQAYQIVMEQMRASGVALLKAKANKSITGGTPSSAVVGRTVPGSAREAVNRAFENIGAR